MDGICSTCLSRDRRLTPVSSQVLEHLFSLKLNWVKENSDICWECRSTLYKCVKFRATALSAHITLDNFLKCPQLPPENIRSLSSLAVQHNNTVQKIHFERSIKTEKKEKDTYPAYEFSDTKRDMQLDDDDFDADSVADALAQGESVADALAQGENVDNPVEVKVEPGALALADKDGDLTGHCHVIRVSMAELQNLRAAARSDRAYGAARSKCAACVRAFRSNSEMARHTEERHSESAGSYICGVCTQRFTHEGALTQHYQEHFICFVCKKCGTSHTSAEEMRTHAKRSHPPKKLARTKKVAKKAPGVKKEKRTLECTICNIGFTTIKRLSYHNCTVHKPLKRCDKCGKKYANNDSLKKHMQAIHNGGLPKQQCPVCNKQYAGQGSLATHMQIQHAQDAGYCAECDRHFKSAYYYRRHIKYNWRHRTEAVMKYECDECGKRFMSKKYVSNHIETVHVRRLNYKCADCGKEYTSNASLGAHVRKHHSTKPRKTTNPNVCEICGKSFKLKKCLSEHMNTHTGARPFVCSVCGDAFAYSSVLYTHNRLKHLRLKARGKAPPAPAPAPEIANAGVYYTTAPRPQPYVEDPTSYNSAQFFRTFRL